MVAVINEMSKRKKEQYYGDDDDNDSLSRSNKKPRRVVWSHDLHKKFVDAVNVLGISKAVPKKIVALMNVEGITTAHVASHLQKYRKAVHEADRDRVPSTVIEPTQSQNMINMSGFPPSTPIQSQNMINMSGVPPSTPIQSQNMINMSGVSPSTLIQSQNMINMSGVSPSTPIQSQNMINMRGFPPSTLSTFPTYHYTSSAPTHVHKPITPLGFPTISDFHNVGTLVGSSASSIQPIHSSSIIHPPPYNFPTYHQSPSFPTDVNPIYHPSSSFPTDVNPIYHPSSSFPTDATLLGFPTTSNFHDIRATNCPFVGSSSKSTSIYDYDLRREPQLPQFPNNSLPVLESHKTSQNSQMKNSQQAHNVEPIIVGSSASLEDTNMNVSEYNGWNDNSFIDFSVEETDPQSLEDIRKTREGIEDDEIMKSWRRFVDEDVTDVM